MSGDYLWDKTGDPDPEVERLEEALGPLRYKERAFEVPADRTLGSGAGADTGAGTDTGTDTGAGAGALKAPGTLSGPTKGRRSGLFVRAVLAAAAALGVLAVALGLTWKSPGELREAAKPSFNEAPFAAWERAAQALAAGLDVEGLEGSPRIGSERMAGRGKLAPGQWLETDEASRARIAIADIGRVTVASSTRLRLVATGPDEHRLDLARGKIAAEVDAPPRLFIVGTPAATAVDLGCAYTLEVDDRGAGSLHVTSGWVALEAPSRSSLVPAGAVCRTKPGVGPGTPVFEDAPAVLKSALDRLDFNEEGALFSGSRAEALSAVLKAARARDSLTLWHLLFRVEAGERRSVLARLRSLAPPPEGVGDREALDLNKPKLDVWLDDLAKSW